MLHLLRMLQTHVLSGHVFARLLAIAFLLFTSGTLHSATATPVLVKDIRPGATGSNPAQHTRFGQLLLFTADDGTTNLELWKSDGTAAGTTLVKDINPGAASSLPGNLLVAGNLVYFRANDGVHGYELWKSDGTTAGTVMVKDILAAEGLGSSATPLAAVGGTLFFSASDVPLLSSLGDFGRELWRSDGSEAGTTLVKDIRPGRADSSPSAAVTVGDSIFFWADDGSHGVELWKSNGSETGTMLVKDIRPGTAGQPLPRSAAVLNGVLYFGADDGATGLELWRSDGTAAGTTLVKEIRPGASGAATAITPVVAGSLLYFWADDGVHGRELWKSDGSAAGTTLVADLNVGVPASYNSPLVSLGNAVYFWAYANGMTPPLALWKSGGTAANTTIVSNVDPGEHGGVCITCDYTELTAQGEMLYFWVHDGGSKRLWLSDGTGAGTEEIGTTFVNDATGDGATDPFGHFRAVHDRLYLAAEGPGNAGRELWSLAIVPVDDDGLDSKVYVPVVLK